MQNLNGQYGCYKQYSYTFTHYGGPARPIAASLGQKELVVIVARRFSLEGMKKVRQLSSLLQLLFTFLELVWGELDGLLGGDHCWPLIHAVKGCLQNWDLCTAMSRHASKAASFEKFNARMVMGILHAPMILLDRALIAYRLWTDFCKLQMIYCKEYTSL